MLVPEETAHQPLARGWLGTRRASLQKMAIATIVLNMFSQLYPQKTLKRI